MQPWSWLGSVEAWAWISVGAVLLMGLLRIVEHWIGKGIGGP